MRARSSRTKTRWYRGGVDIARASPRIRVLHKSSRLYRYPRLRGATRRRSIVTLSRAKSKRPICSRHSRSSAFGLLSNSLGARDAPSAEREQQAFRTEMHAVILGSVPSDLALPGSANGRGSRHLAGSRFVLLRLDRSGHGHAAGAPVRHCWCRTGAARPVPSRRIPAPMRRQVSARPSPATRLSPIRGPGAEPASDASSTRWRGAVRLEHGGILRAAAIGMVGLLDCGSSRPRC